jgi:hypothetical protein
MSHNAIFSVKVERPHKSIKVTRKAFRRRRQRRRLQGEFSIFLYLSLTLPCQGRWETRAQGRQKVEVCKREEKPPSQKWGKPGRFETPTTRIKCSCKNISSHLRYLSNCSHAPFKSALTPCTLHLARYVCRYPITTWGSGASPLHGLIIRSSGPITV